ncbi:MAG: OmpA family protein [Ignavibacteriae bacterium]|nr:OmpA family protein [Ignavibacteriota bacterium]
MEEKNEIPQNSLRSFDEYLLCEEYKGENDFFKFEKNNKFYFALNSDGKTYLRSQSYTSEIARNNGISSIHRNSLLDERWLKTQTNDNKYFFCLIAGNKQEIARSCYYNSVNEMEKDYEWVRGENSIIGIGATEINGVWFSAAKLFTENKVDNIIENKIEELDLVADLKSEQKKVSEEIKLEKIEQPKIEKIAGEIPQTIIEKKGGCGKLWIWFLLAVLILIVCFIFCKGCNETNNLTNSIVLKSENVAEIISDKESEIEKPIGEIKNSEILEKIENALKNDISFTIEQLNNDFEMSNLSDNSKIQLNEIGNYLRNHEELILEIHAHTDDVGKDENNKKTSLAKAELIKKYLVENGISEAKINTIGFGERFPISSNLTDEGKAKNRRFEFKFIK